MKKIVIAFLLGVLSFLLSRGNPDAWRSDWRIMLALDAVTLIVVCIMVTAEKRDVVLAQAPGWLLSTCGGTLAGALAASMAARRTAP